MAGNTHDQISFWSRFGRALAFVAGGVVAGLALAFIALLVRPELLRGRQAATAPPASAVVPAITPLASNSEPPPASTPATTPGSAATPATAIDTLAAQSYAPAVRRAAPAVVNISTARVVTEPLQLSPFTPWMGDLQPFYHHRVEHALGSGVIIDGSGHIVTNNHVIANADSIQVQLADGRTARATVVGRDADTDLALLSVALPHMPVMPMGNSNDLQVGDVVLAIGDPLGLSQTVTHGIVSFRGRQQLGVATFEDFIQTDAPINAGNSGGALISASGDLVGINTAVLNKSVTGDINVAGIGFAIPVNLVRGVVREILASGHVIRGWVGILPEDVDDEQARQLNLPRGGVVITNMYRNSPAAQSSVQVGDIITAVDGHAVQRAHDALSLIAAKAPGSEVTLHIVRASGSADVRMKVTERPDAIRGT